MVGSERASVVDWVSTRERRCGVRELIEKGLDSGVLVVEASLGRGTAIWGRKCTCSSACRAKGQCWGNCAIARCGR